MLGLEIGSDGYEVHVNVMNWANADFGGGMLNCSELLVPLKWFCPPQHPSVYPRFHAPFAQGLHFNLPICCNCFESWLARHIFFKAPQSDTHAHVCVRSWTSQTPAPMHTSTHTPSDVHEKRGRRALSNTSAVCSPKRLHYNAVISPQIFPSWIWKIQ